MRIGYPCINRSIGCTANSTFRLRSYSGELLFRKTEANLSCLRRILGFNLSRGLLFFRISSDIVPFASHPVCTAKWEKRFRSDFRTIGSFIRKQGMRISMHPDQFILLNSPDRNIVRRSTAELEYHCRVLDAMGTGPAAKVQIHVGGVYGDKNAAVRRFLEEYRRLPPRIRKRLVIENDERSYSLADCLSISRECGIPVLFDSFHHECLNNGESVREAMLAASATWKKKDGPPMADYSSQNKEKRKGSHAESIDMRHFRKFVKAVEGIDFDLMLEIKDKEKSALKAAALLRKTGRL